MFQVVSGNNVLEPEDARVDHAVDQYAMNRFEELYNVTIVTLGG